MNNRSVHGTLFLLAASVLSVSTAAHGQIFRAYLASGNTETHNEIGFLRSSGTFDSAGNNVLRDNATPTMGTVTTLTTL